MIYFCKISIRLFSILLFVVFLCSYLSADELVTLKHQKVQKVIDGDTIAVINHGKRIKIRLIGIQAPEVFTQPAWPYGKEASDALSKKLSNQYVDIKYVVGQKKDKYKRILGVVFLGSENMNQYMIENGYAFVYIIGNSKIPFVDNYVKLENKAINKHLNLWTNEKYKVISPEDTDKYVNQYKLIDGTVKKIKQTQHGVWMSLQDNDMYGFSVFISNYFVGENNININDYKGKKIRIRGFIDKYSTKFGPFVNVRSKYAVEIM